MKKSLVSMIGLSVFLAVGCVNAQTSVSGDTTIAALMQSVPQWMAANHVPATGVGLIENGKIKWAQVFGQNKPGTPAPENTLFNIASQTKPVTAMMVMQLVNTGSWNLDEPLAHFWIDPDLEGDSNLNKLTTRLVLSHQTGFPNWRTDNSGSKLRFINPPGTKFGYSGEGFEYLRRALENKLHRTLDQLDDSLVFKPAGMKQTQYWSAGMDTSRFAHWHDGQGRRYEISEQTPVSAADDLITSVADYCRFGIWVMKGMGLKDSLLRDVVSPQVKTKENYYRGLGWGLLKGLPGDAYALEHGGSDVGVRTMAIFLPKSGSGIVVLTNADNGLFVYDQIIKMALPSGSSLLATMNAGSSHHERTELPASTLDRYAGIYTQGNGKKILIVREGNSLKVSGDGAPTSLVLPESNTRFFLADYDVQLEFMPASTGNGMTLTIFENGKQVMKIERDNSSKTN